MRIATWNVNSLRSRIDRVEAFLDRHDIDVLALQETKAREDQLPLMGLQARGYEIAVAGVNQWNGVALISRVGLEDVTVGFADMPGYGEPLAAEARAIGAICGGAGGVRIWSLYVPNGRKPDDPHYVYKLDWLSRLRAAATPWREEETVLVGDWNICPTDADVFDPAQFTKSTHVTPPERAAFQAFLDDGYVEVTREHAPGYTYWDYYRQRFERDRGLKIDFALASPALAKRVTGAFIDRDERDPAQGAGSPSDHAPVIVD
ncbi:MAG: exodeoxyribonuclease III, partial [Nocardioides sp.]|uniref:exodeoxyribonuclease III n=1 Tax=Nocardioides sp. TaxID=35761 RepID=UPI003265349C